MAAAHPSLQVLILLKAEMWSAQFLLNFSNAALRFILITSRNAWNILHICVLTFRWGFAPMSLHAFLLCKGFYVTVYLCYKRCLLNTFDSHHRSHDICKNWTRHKNASVFTCNMATALKSGNTVDTGQNGFKHHELEKMQCNGSLERQKTCLNMTQLFFFLNLLLASAVHFKWTPSPILESHRDAVHSSLQQSVTAH